MGVSTNMPRHPLTLVTPQATPSRRGTRPPSQVKESTSCVCISMSLSNPNHTTQVCLKNTPVFQTIETRKLTTNHNWVDRTHQTSTRLSIWLSWPVLGYDTSSNQSSNHQVYPSGSSTCPHLLSTMSRVAN